MQKTAEAVSVGHSDKKADYISSYVLDRFLEQDAQVKYGVKTTHVIDSQVYFDLDGNGFAEKTAWADADDGFLVRDLNGNGMIDNGSELFGNNTVLSNGQKAANGFEALKDLDSNGDGVFEKIAA